MAMFWTSRGGCHIPWPRTAYAGPMPSGIARSLLATSAASVLLLIAACADPDDTESGGGSGTTVVTVGPADTATVPPTTVPPPPGPDDTMPLETSYEIKAGDTLYGIAEAYSVDVNLIVSYNSWEDGINHPINPGETILIPPGWKQPQDTTVPPTSDETETTDEETEDTSDDESTDTTEGDGEDEDTSTTVDTGEGGTYTVVDGDTLFGIAEKVGSTAQAIAEANGWEDGIEHVIYAGLEIRIP